MSVARAELSLRKVVSFHPRIRQVHIFFTNIVSLSLRSVLCFCVGVWELSSPVVPVLKYEALVAF